MRRTRERYRVDLLELQCACEANYVQLLRLLPEMRSQLGLLRRIALSQGDRQLGILALEVLETAPYTTLLAVRHEHCMTWLPVPKMEVRVYHDARMAEVISAQNARCLQGIYPYPNAHMYQPDEKTQLNLFLGEWLGHCLMMGHESAPII